MEKQPIASWTRTSLAAFWWNRSCRNLYLHVSSTQRVLIWSVQGYSVIAFYWRKAPERTAIPVKLPKPALDYSIGFIFFIRKEIKKREREKYWVILRWFAGEQIKLSRRIKPGAPGPFSPSQVWGTGVNMDLSESKPPFVPVSDSLLNFWMTFSKTAYDFAFHSLFIPLPGESSALHSYKRDLEFYTRKKNFIIARDKHQGCFGWYDLISGCYSFLLEWCSYFCFLFPLL